MVSGITISPKWEMFTAALGVTPFDKNHTSKNTLDLTKDLLAQYGLKLTDIISCTTVTASAAFNTFDIVDISDSMLCSFSRSFFKTRFRISESCCCLKRNSRFSSSSQSFS